MSLLPLSIPLGKHAAAGSACRQRRSRPALNSAAALLVNVGSSSTVSLGFKKKGSFDAEKKKSHKGLQLHFTGNPYHHIDMTEKHMTPEADKLWLGFLVHRVHEKNTVAPDLLSSQRSRCLLLRKSNHCTLTVSDHISLKSIRFNRIRIKSSLERLLNLPSWQGEGAALPSGKAAAAPLIYRHWIKPGSIRRVMARLQAK